MRVSAVMRNATDTGFENMSLTLAACPRVGEELVVPARVLIGRVYRVCHVARVDDADPYAIVWCEGIHDGVRPVVVQGEISCWGDKFNDD